MEVVKPLLAEGSATALAEAVNARWTSQEICPLLQDCQSCTRKLAAMTLAMVGDRGCVGCLAKALHDPDEQVAELAEHGLWGVWFRLGNDAALLAFREGVELMEQEAYEPAVLALRRSIAADPTFAEAQNQCALACYGMEDYETAIAHSDRAVALMPVHFGAIAGRGHCLAELGRCREAFTAYRHAVQINPRLTEIAELLASCQGLHETGTDPVRGQV